jgi:two-component system sensor histidine kinase KdpD
VWGPRAVVGYAVAVGGTALVSSGLLLIRSHVSKTNLVLAFLLVVVGAAANGGLGPGATAAALGFLAFDFLFIPPYYTFVVADRQDYLSLAAYLLVAVVISALVGELARRRRQAEQRERETRTLYELSSSLVAQGSLDEVLASVTRTVRGLFDLAGCAILLPDPEQEQGRGVRVAAAAGQVPADLDGMPSAGVLLPARSMVRAGTGRLEPGKTLTVPMRGPAGPVGALVVVAGSVETAGFGEAERRLLTTFANQAALAVRQAQQEEERARARALAETDRLRTALLNSVSHDLRTPLTSLKASASSLLDQEVAWTEEQRREFLTIIDKGVDRLTRLVHNLLDMSRIEAGALQPNLAETSLAEVVGVVIGEARLVAKWTPRAADRGLRRIDMDVPESLPPVLVDPVRLDQVLTNLLDNACRYAPGPVAITGRAVDGDRAVELRVVDHGPGIPGPERERVFDQFYRLKGGGKRPEGTGMGLAICRGIVGAFGGTLRVETTPGGGATLVITLPVADAMDATIGDGASGKPEAVIR